MSYNHGIQILESKDKIHQITLYDFKKKVMFTANESNYFFFKNDIKKIYIYPKDIFYISSETFYQILGNFQYVGTEVFIEFIKNFKLEEMLI
jgi:hypothetical protein